MASTTSNTNAAAGCTIAAADGAAGAPTAAGTPQTTAASTFKPLLRAALGPKPPVRFEFWDGSALGPKDDSGKVVVHSQDAAARMLASGVIVGAPVRPVEPPATFT